MPKILRIINRFNLGGPTYNAAYLTKYLSPDFETLLIGGVKDDGEESSEFILKELGIEYQIIPEMRRDIKLSNDREALKKVRAIIKAYQPDIVHTHASKAGTIGRIAAYKEKVPVVVHTFHGHVFHSYFGKLKTGFYINIERFLAKKSSKIIAISQTQKKELAEVFKIAPKEKIEVIPLGFDLEKFWIDQTNKRNDFRKTYQLDEDEIAIGIIGRLAPVKNHSMFIEAIKSLKSYEKFNKIRFFIIGDGSEKQNIFHHINQSDLKFVNWIENQKKATITFTSWIKNVDWALSGLDVVVLTSNNEGTPVSLIEAQAASKPVISTNVGGVSDIMLNEKTGFIVPKNDIIALKNKIIELVENKELCAQFGAQGKAFVKEKFHYNRLVEDMKKLYNSLLSQ